MVLRLLKHFLDSTYNSVSVTSFLEGVDSLYSCTSWTRHIIFELAWMRLVLGKNHVGGSKDCLSAKASRLWPRKTLLDAAVRKGFGEHGCHGRDARGES